MSGCSDSAKCPRCGSANMNANSDWKPFDTVSGECLECGFTYWTEVSLMTLKEVNELRKDYEMKPLKALPKIDPKEDAANGWYRKKE